MQGKNRRFLLIAMVACFLLSSCSWFASQNAKQTPTVISQQKVIPTIDEPMHYMTACERIPRISGGKDDKAVRVKLYSQKNMKGICYFLSEIATYPFKKLSDDFSIVGGNIQSMFIDKDNNVVFRTTHKSGATQLDVPVAAGTKIPDFDKFQQDKGIYHSITEMTIKVA